LKFEEPIAIFIRDGGYLKNQVREYGIDLVWSDKPEYQWQIRGGMPGSNISTLGLVSLYNMEVGDFLVYKERTYGINLKWYQDARNKGQKISVRSENSGTSTVFIVSGEGFSPNSNIVIRMSRGPFDITDFQQTAGSDGKFVSRHSVPCISGNVHFFTAFEGADPNHTQANPFTITCP
jgi:hypothetical protein